MKRIALAVMICCGVSSLSPATAAILTWDISPGTVGVGNGTVTGGAGSWNTTGTNGVWTSDAGANNVAWTNNATAPNSAIFGGGSGSPITVTVGTVNAQDITFNATTSGNYSLSGGTITLGNTTAGVQTPTPNITANVNATIGSVLAGNDGFIKDGSGTLTLSATQSNTGAVTVNQGILSLTGPNAANSGLYAASGITINNGGTLLVSTANALHGASSTAGTVTIKTGGVMTTANTIPSHIRGALELSGGTLASGTPNASFGSWLLSSDVTANGATTSTISASQVSWTGTRIFTVDAGSTLNVTGTLAFPGGFAGALTKDGGGAMSLSGANNFTGGVTVNGGNLIASTSSNALGTAGTITVNTGGTLTWAVNGFNTFPSRTLNILGGTVSINSTTNNAHNYSSGTLTMQGGTLTSINGVGGPANDGGFGNFILNNSTLIVSGTSQSLISTTTFGMVGTSSFNVGTTGAGVDLLVQSAIISNAGGSNLTKNGSGKMVLTGANSYATATNINAGVLNIQDNTALGTTAAGTSVASGAALEIQGNLTVGAEALTLNGSGISSGGALRNVSGTNTYGGLITLGSAARINSDSGSLTLSNTGTITGSGFGLTVGGAGDTTINSIIGTGAGTFTKDGAGTVTLTAANTFTGGTTVDQGTLSLGRNGTGDGIGTIRGVLTANSGATVIASAVAATGFTAGVSISTLNLVGGTFNNATSGNQGYRTSVNLTGGAMTSTGGGNFNFTSGFGITSNASSTTSTISGGIDIRDSSTLSLNVAAGTTPSGVDLAIFGVINNATSGSGAVSKSGGGKLVLSGANTYTGATSVSAGVLNIQNNSALGTTAAGTSVASGAALEIQGNLTVGAEALTLNGSGISNGGALRNISGTNTYGGLVALGSAARINSDSGSLILSNTGTITGSGFGLTVGGAGDTTINSIIGTGAGTFTKDGAGTVTLAAANTFTGGVAVNQGLLLVNGSLAASANAVTVGSGATLGGSGVINRAVNINAGGTLSPGNSPDQIFTGALTLAPLSIYEIEILGPAVGDGVTGYDQTVVTGGVSLNGAFLSLLTITGVGVGDSFTIIDNDGFDPVTGAFAGLAEGAEFVAGSFYVSITYAGGVNNNDVVLTVNQIVPEPGSLTLCGLALLAGMGYVWKRKRRS